MKGKGMITLLLSGVCALSSFGQSRHWQHNSRKLHYTENQGDFLLVNGRYRFNRALYGNHKASRVEAGDLPEFALYMPGMAGNLQFVIEGNGTYKKLIDADHIETRYRPGSMIYCITDSILGAGSIEIQVLAQTEEEGMVVKLEGAGVSKNVKLYAIYGGASGEKFSRGGDIGADPESGFYLLPEYAENNRFDLQGQSFTLHYQDAKKNPYQVHGTFSGAATLQLSDATSLADLMHLTSTQAQKSPIVYQAYQLADEAIYIQVAGGALPDASVSDQDLKERFNRAEQARLALTERVHIHTPDRFINNLGETLAAASDGVWESPTYMHGAIAWRMRLNAWRGAYTADALGWHDRAKAHFSSYAASQVVEPASGPVVMDTALHLARHQEKMGTAMFSSGYISRNPNNNTIAHHYDMNLVFIDQLLSHFDYTGDVDYLREMWPTIERHLAWERRNFKRNGLYDAYCAIWASDALQYSGGGVAHTSAYNYRANKAAAKLARIIGKDASLYEQEAEAIAKAMKERLWLGEKGYFAEYQDTLGNQLLHDKPGLWTIYHVADAYLLNDFENYQNSRYIDNYLPHIPIRVEGEEDQGFYTLATTAWQPYTWSVNNVALAENLQASLAYWQSGRSNEAFRLWKGNLVESMYHGKSPGNFQQLSHYDAFRGELYRDFADPIGVASRTLTEGLFGFFPKLMEGKILIKPGFPSDWDFAEIALPDWSYNYRKDQMQTSFKVQLNYEQAVGLDMEVPVNYAEVRAVRVNGQEVAWQLKSSAIGQPVLVFEAPKAKAFEVQIQGKGNLSLPSNVDVRQAYTESYRLPLAAGVQVLEVYDPQQLLSGQEQNQFQFVQAARKGTFFVKLQQGAMTWWHPVNIDLQHPVASEFVARNDEHVLVLHNPSSEVQRVKLQGVGLSEEVALVAGARKEMLLPADALSIGTNQIQIQVGEQRWTADYKLWNLAKQANFQMQDLSTHYNSRVSDIFEQKYLSPRIAKPTLQLPWQGIGNWCYPLVETKIDDSGLMAARKAEQVNYLGIPFLIKGNNKNILFTSQWDNYPTQAEIPLQGQAEKVYLLMAGSTNPMQSQLVNARVQVNYTDGSHAVLELKNPSNWWPIEQDYLDDNYAFEIPDEEIPYRVQLKTGALYKGGTLSKYSSIKGYTDRAVEGGAATILDLPLDSRKTLKSLQLITEANDVVVGLMAATLLTK